MRGHSPLAVCDRCGFKFKLSELRKEWTGLDGWSLAVGR
jgi:hypothetical protein